VTSRVELFDAVTDLIHSQAGADARDMVLTYELYLAALREPALRAITEAWMQRSRAALERFIDPVTARGLDALIEGLVMHGALSTAPLERAQIHSLVRRMLG
jgi:TetR/AcrR family transcriptional regulator, regulator of biofilm formation and stress response